jgi:two-component system, chemotaxis family, sensor kinase Cph1
MTRFAPNPSPADRVTEAIEFAASIQPYGLLLVLQEPDLIVLQVSANVQEYFDVAPIDLLGQPLSKLLNAPSIEIIQQALATFSHGMSLHLKQVGQRFNGTLHRAAAGLILELEPASEPSLPQAQSLPQTIAQLRRISDRTTFLQTAAAEIRRLSQFDRVLIYQFDPQGAGEVVAEAKSAGLSSYLGLHYPATDIPEPVRALYRQGLVRYIPDLEAPSVDLLPPANPLTQCPLDLTFSRLRSVDPCCVDYHHNMGVAAIFVVALLQEETLWGLISCHHAKPKPLAPEVRQDCEVLGHLIASELANKVNLAELNYWMKLRSLQSDFVQSIAQVDDLKQALTDPAPRLLDLVSAQGAAICLEDEIHLVGATPSLEQVGALMQWLDAQPTPTHLFHTDSLPKAYAAAAEFKDCASGLLRLQISQVRRYSILWFRPEVLQTINWAGDPNASLTVAADGKLVLCPRQSFEQWQEIVRSTALPWQNCELESVLDLRSAIVGIVLKKADELARINQALERSNQELDSFAYAASHDLKEPLRGIHNYSNLLLKGYAEILDDTGKSRLQTLVRLTRRMESLTDALLKFSRLGQAELHLQATDLNLCLQQILEELPINHPDLQVEIRRPRPLPTIACDPILVQEVFTNLLSNAIKYNDKPQRWVEVDYLASDSIIFYIRDNGIGIRDRHQNSIFRLFKRLHEQHLYGGGTGAGLTIAKKIIERHNGKIWVESTPGEGTTFYFTLG